MTLTQQVQKDLVDALRKQEELRLSTLRMMKAALKNREIESALRSTRRKSCRFSAP